MQRRNSNSVKADAEGTASAKLELSTMLDLYGGLSAGAGVIDANEGEIEINNTNIKINRDVTIFLSLTIVLDGFGLVILKQKRNYFFIVDEQIRHSKKSSIL